MITVVVRVHLEVRWEDWMTPSCVCAVLADDIGCYGARFPRRVQLLMHGIFIT